MRRIAPVLILAASAIMLPAAVGHHQPRDPGTIEGSVTNEAGGAIAGARVKGPSQLEATTNTDGVYRLDNVGSGAIAVTAAAPGYRAATLTVRVVDDSSTQANFTLKADTSRVVRP